LHQNAFGGQVPPGHGLKLLASASASRHYGLGRKILASTSKFGVM